MPQRVIVVGAGAAGLMAAGRAAEQGAATLLVEATQQLGTKLSLAGGGRGNVAADLDVEACLAHYSPAGLFLRNSLSRWGVPQLRQFLARIGVPTKVDGQQRVYPVSERALDLVEALVAYAKSQGVELLTGWRCSQVLVERERVRGVRAADGRALEGDAVILATGGVTYPETGSRGDGLHMAQLMGHTVSEPRPGLVSLEVSDARVAGLAGVSLPWVILRATRRDGSVAETSGPLLFTHRGVSGPAALDLSVRIAHDLGEGEIVAEMDIRPSLATDVKTHVAEQRCRQGARSVRNVIGGLMPRRLAMALLEGCDVDPNTQVAQLGTRELDALVRRLRAWPLCITGTGPLRSAMVTVGGVSTSEVNPRTMASRRTEGLYLCGELLDVAGDTGGFNLLMAFSTGWVAGESAARAVGRR